MRERGTLAPSGLRLRAFALVARDRGPGAAIAVAPAGAVPGNFWGVVPQATPTAEQFQRLKRGGVDSIRIPIAWGARAAPAATDPST